MTNAQMHDVGSQIVTVLALAGATITAGAGNDNTELNGLSIDRTKVPGGNCGPALSAQFAIPYVAVLAAAATLAYTANAQEDAVTGFNGTPADLKLTRARHITEAGVVTDLALDANGNLPATVVATGPGGGGTVRGTVLLDVDLSSARDFVRLQRTANLSAANTDTVNDSAVAVLGGFFQRAA